MKKRLIASALLFTGSAVGLFAASGGVVRVAGASTMKEFGQRLTEWYAKKYPAVKFEVVAATPENSFAAMAGGKTEVVQSSRRVLNSEIEALRAGQGKKYVEIQVATEIAGIAVNSRNPVKDLSLYQLRQVLSGSVKNWKQVGGNDAPIVIYGRDGTSGVRSFLEDEFMGDEGVSSSAKTFASNSAMFAALSKDPNGVGFGSVEMRPDAQVRFLGIKASASDAAIAPTGDAIRAKKYTLVRPLYFYFAGKPQGELLRFAEWALSPEGQLVVEAVGYFPLSSAERVAGREALTKN
ncbi:MAG TPA: PstS family phosphate ABC transporter substrate-binding protein [Candidatus Acidoferrum sp.]|nr:PstS family phosphate ABC transporter substrate-binding protein [Candidatus Acidoferrum sp.]